MQHTKYNYQVQAITPASANNWLFLPGGPGIGSEYLHELVNNLQLPGGKFLLDFPMDGTNSCGELSLATWQVGLLDLLQGFVNPILVTHSFSGMFALTMPELQNKLHGLVLMNTTTGSTFFPHVFAMQDKYNLPDLSFVFTDYHADPSQAGYKKYWEVYKYYCFTAEEMLQGEEMLQKFAYNNQSYNYVVQNFYVDYNSKWVPNSLPTLTIASEFDYICPPDIFIADGNYQRANILNKIILDAGHCPWLKHFNQVQNCFVEYCEKFALV